MGLKDTGTVNNESDAGAGHGRTINRDPGDNGPLNPSATKGTRGYNPVRFDLNEPVRYNTTDVKITVTPDPVKASGGGRRRQPWDVYSMVGVGTPDPDTGIYPDYDGWVWPGGISSMMPSGIMAAVRVAKDLTYWKAVCTTNGYNITSVAIVANTTAAVAQAPTKNILPTIFEVLFAVTLDGKAYRTIGDGNPAASSKVTLVTNVATAPAPGMRTQDFWYIWEVIA